jgi:hypothetical protein
LFLSGHDAKVRGWRSIVPQFADSPRAIATSLLNVSRPDDRRIQKQIYLSASSGRRQVFDPPA